MTSYFAHPVSRPRSSQPNAAGGPDAIVPQGVAMGTLKWYDPKSGFGFVVSDQLEKDALLRANVIEEFGETHIAAGTEVSFSFEVTNRGFAVTRLLDMALPDPALNPSDDLDLSKMHPARLRWFDPAKGYGFVRCFGAREDAFLSKATLLRSGLTQIDTGDAVCVNLQRSARGYTVRNLKDWSASFPA